MSVPLDNLYHWLESMLPSPALLYVFQPHGSKKISDCDRFREYDHYEHWKLPGIVVHDQEPLDWDLYQQPDQYIECWKNKHKSIYELTPEVDTYLQLRYNYCSNFNLKSLVYLYCIMYDDVILIHSEQNSRDLQKYKNNGFLCVHYWSHAVISLDWYRFAQHDARLHYNAPAKNLFLIYCRDWSHRREYRLKFLEMLIQNDLVDDSQVSVMYTNSENVHFLQHRFKNTAFELDNAKLIYHIPNNEFPGSASGNYQSSDFVNSEISVILETVFDDCRVHLTEKTLRSIACGHPFILAAGPGSLEYLKNYGFKTFGQWIDESYDQETNSLERLKKIVCAMKKIQALQGQDLEMFRQGVKQIAEFNKQHFFSTKFFDLLQYELKNNLNQAFESIKRSKGKHYLGSLAMIKKHKLMHLFYGGNQERKKRIDFLKQLRQSYPSDHSIHREDPAI